MSTTLVRRDEAKPGMIFQSSHGYRLLITEVRDNAGNRVDDRGVEIVGHLHANRENATRTECYPANSKIRVEIPMDLISVLERRVKTLVGRMHEREAIRQYAGDCTRGRISELERTIALLKAGINEGEITMKGVEPA